MNLPSVDYLSITCIFFTLKKYTYFEVNDEMNEINNKYDIKVIDYTNYIIHDAIVYNEYVKNYNTNN